jgi:hypothetical protein
MDELHYAQEAERRPPRAPLSRASSRSSLPLGAVCAKEPSVPGVLADQPARSAGGRGRPPLSARMSAGMRGSLTESAPISGKLQVELAAERRVRRDERRLDCLSARMTASLRGACSMACSAKRPHLVRSVSAGQGRAPAECALCRPSSRLSSPPSAECAAARGVCLNLGLHEGVFA